MKVIVPVLPTGIGIVAGVEDLLLGLMGAGSQPSMVSSTSSVRIARTAVVLPSRNRAAVLMLSVVLHMRSLSRCCG
jgi:hypothetical protein